MWTMMWIQNVHQSFHTSHNNFNYNHNKRIFKNIFCFASYKRIVVEGTPLLMQIGGIVKKSNWGVVSLEITCKSSCNSCVTNHEQHETQSLKL